MENPSFSRDLAVAASSPQADGAPPRDCARHAGPDMRPAHVRRLFSVTKADQNGSDHHSSNLRRALLPRSSQVLRTFVVVTYTESCLISPALCADTFLQVN